MSETSFTENLVNIHITTAAKVMQTNIWAEAIFMEDLMTTHIFKCRNGQKHDQCCFIHQVVISFPLKPNSASVGWNTHFLPVDGNKEPILNALVTLYSFFFTVGKLQNDAQPK